MLHPHTYPAFFLLFTLTFHTVFSSSCPSITSCPACLIFALLCALFFILFILGHTRMTVEQFNHFINVHVVILKYMSSTYSETWHSNVTSFAF